MRLSNKRIYITTSLVTYTTAQQSLDSDCRQRTAERDGVAPTVSTGCIEITVVPCGGIPKMFKELFADDNERGVSPVIGVILMVAITVILAAVIGAFVLGFGDRVSEQPPTAQIGFDFNGNTSVDITHDGGDPIANDSVTFRSGSGATSDSLNWSSGDEDITAGDTVTLDSGASGIESADVGTGNTVRVIWQGEGSSNTIAQRDWP